MIVVHLATTLAGGAGIGLWRYHRALLAVGIDSRILVMNPPPGLESEVARVHWRKHTLPLRIAQRLGLWSPRNERLRRKIEALDRSSPGQARYELFSTPFSDYCPEEHPWIAEADVINLHWTAGILDWSRFFDRVRKPAVITLHDQYPYLGGFHYAQEAANNPQLASLEARMRDIKRRALVGYRIGVVANSRWNATEALASGFFTPGTPIETIYYPLDAGVFSPRNPSAAKAAAGVPLGRKVIGFACENLNNARKGFADLVDAVIHLPEALRSQITLLSFGRDPSPELTALVKLPWIHLGYLATDEAKVAAYAAMDVFVVPSREEAFGLTALEAEAVGIPVVASRVGGLAEAVPSAVPPTPEALRDGIAGLLSDDLSRARLSTEGRRLVLERHDPVAIGRQLAGFYRTLLG